MCRPNPIFCIIPPHILTAIIHNGTDEHRAHALNTLIHTERLRGKRQALRAFDLKTPKNMGLNRIIQSAEGTQTKQVTVRTEGQGLTGDQAVDEAYAYLGASYNFFQEAFGRNSYNNQGATLYATVHYGKNFDNAFWDGQRSVYGDGDGKIFSLFTKCPEIIGHETTHGVTEFSSQLIYQNQAGALNEAISDIMGLMVKQKLMNQTSTESDWIVGEGVFMPNINGVGVRDIKNPGEAYNDPLLGKDPCPASMANFVHTSQDNGGIHINCTIPAHAFYLSAVERGGYAWQHVGKAWYAAQTTLLKKNTNFQQFADMTLKTARKIFGSGTLELKAINKGWKTVGIL